MAAFCGCCGAEITLKDEACTVCGTPHHGMALAPDSLSSDGLFEPTPHSDLPSSAPRKPTGCSRS